jgi:serine protease AprX
MAENKRRLPIKVVTPTEHDLITPRGGRGPRKTFGSANRKLRNKLLAQVASVKDYFGQQLRPHGLHVVARVVLKTPAMAKSHRPLHLFCKETCPVIGSEAFGTMLVSMNADGLARLERRISVGVTKDVEADLTTVDHIEPYTAKDALGTMELRDFNKYLTEEKTHKIKFRLFRHRIAKADTNLMDAFKQLVSQLKLPTPEVLNYAENCRLFRLRNVRPENLENLAKFVGTQSIRPFPRFGLLAQYLPQGNVTTSSFPAPTPNRLYPLVGLIDTGTDPDNPHLSAWVAHRDEDDVPRADQNNDHGSFVGGLIANARALNHGDVRFPSAQAKILDVVAMPTDGTTVDEDDLLQIISRVVVKYPDVKVWNLSISRVSDICQDDAFSDFAMALDSLQKQHDVTFAICTGNYTTPPLRTWRPQKDLGEDADRVHPPADSIHAVTVGSVAHNDHATTCVRRGEPSPFSRRGPGAAYLPKPEVCHYGGNCDAAGNYQQVGVLSLDGRGNIAEAVGTSFSTPLIATVLANIRAGVVNPISRNLAKALLVHSAALESGPVTADKLPYYGFGIPGEVSDILTCAPWQATLIFEPELQPQRKVFSKLDFPIPECFRRPDNTVDGEFLMTLVYDPPCDPSAGAEYCRVNVEVSLGTYDPGKGGKPKHSRQIPPEPKDYTRLFEKHLVEHGFKWSPVKVFRERLEKAGGSRWRLMMKLLYRSETDLLRPQRVALVVTMFDPERRRPVYDDVARAMAVSGWVTQDLRIDERIRARGR